MRKFYIIMLLITLCAMPYVSFADERWYYLGTHEVAGEMYFFDKTKCFFYSKDNKLTAVERILNINQQSKERTVRAVAEFVKLHPERRSNPHVEITNVVYTDEFVEYVVIENVIHQRCVKLQFRDNKENLIYDTGTLYSKFMPIKHNSNGYTTYMKELKYAKII